MTEQLNNSNNSPRSSPFCLSQCGGSESRPPGFISSSAAYWPRGLGQVFSPLCLRFPVCKTGITGVKWGNLLPCLTHIKCTCLLGILPPTSVASKLHLIIFQSAPADNWIPKHQAYWRHAQGTETGHMKAAYPSSQLALQGSGGHRSRGPRSVRGTWGQAGWEESQVRERQGRDKHQAGGEARGKRWGSGQTLLLCFNKQSSTIPEWNRLGNPGNGQSTPKIPL